MGELAAVNQETFAFEGLEYSTLKAALASATDLDIDEVWPIGTRVRIEGQGRVVGVKFVEKKVGKDGPTIVIRTHVIEVEEAELGRA